MLIYILLAIISPVLLMSYIVIRKKSETNKSFFQTIKTCSDENFILQCGIISNTKDALVALKIRNVIAKLGRVPPEYISPKKTEFITYKYERMGIDFCKWKKEDFASKIIIYKNRTVNIDIGIQKDGIFYPFGKDVLGTLKQLNYHFSGTTRDVSYVKIEDCVLTINQRESDPILYILDVYGENPFAITFQGCIIFFPINLQKMQKHFGNEYQTLSFPFE